MTNYLRKFLLMDHHVCPWWLGYTFDNPLRRILHNPEKILGGLISAGQTAIDIGCGHGHFTLGMARLVGEGGRVIAADLQEKMLDIVKRRAERAGLMSRICLYQCRPDTIGINDTADFILTCWMLHEVPDKESFLREVRVMMKLTSRFLFIEPVLHVSARNFQKSVKIARSARLLPETELYIRLSRATLFSAG